MSNEPHNLILDQLRYVRNDIETMRKEVTHELHSLSERVSAVEKHMGGLFTSLTNLGGDVAKLKFDMRTVKARLDITDDDEHPA